MRNMEGINYLLATYVYASLIVIVAVAIYGIIAKPNLIKKIIALTILGDTVNTFIILIGYRFVSKPKPPVIPTLHPSPEDIINVVKYGVDPLPQAFVITAIVINLAITAFLVMLVVRTYRAYGTLEMDLIERRKGGS
ncbi:MAG TPA: Na+/H+ antiporter subunit C, partial [Acidilobales archaeon]|nr:Na+/H+ antiporter subunit C [Acidilobales archaeon]